MNPTNTTSRSRDGLLLLATRIVRLFAYGFLSVFLALYLAALGFDDAGIGLLLTLTLLGDTAVSLWLTTRADRFGRRRMLLVGACLMVAAGIAFASTDRFALLLLAAIIGVISPSGNEVGPFLAIEQAALSQVVADRRRTSIFAWYNMSGSFATALGALSGGAFVQWLQNRPLTLLASYRIAVVGYAVFGLVLLGLFTWLSPSVEAPAAGARPAPRSEVKPLFGLRHSRPVVLRLAGLFALDAFGGGFVIQSLLAYWFYLRFGADPATLGRIFFLANLLAGVSALAAVRLATRFGLINTMVFTHLPSNVLLILVPLMPTLPLAILVLMLRFSISQMDVPTRQSYTLAVVKPEERAAAAGVTNVARTTGAALAPLFAGYFLGIPVLWNLPFFIAGGLKIVYDLLLYRSFRKLRAPEEQQ